MKSITKLTYLETLKFIQLIVVVVFLFVSFITENKVIVKFTYVVKKKFLKKLDQNEINLKTLNQRV